jgi:multiple sugar transport system ATP-binding protein
MVFQSYALYPHLTVGQNMEVPLRLRELGFFERFPVIGRMLARGKFQAISRQVAETADVLQIGQLLDRKPGQLSGGQRQRAALGRAMVRQPVAFLMDEPLSNLDAALRVHMRAELAELHRALGVTFVYVTHDQAEALTMSDRMAVMMAGEILQLDDPATVYENPKDLRVARFVGSPKINTLNAAIDAEGYVHALDVTLARQVDAAHHGKAVLGLRPEHLQLCAPTQPAAFSGTVVHRENLGADIYLHLDIGPSRLVVRCKPEKAEALSVGDTAAAAPVPGKAMLFHPDGARLGLSDEPVSTSQAVVA